MEKEEMIKMRDTFKDLAEVLDEIIILSDKEDRGEEIDKKEYDSKLGLFTFKMLELAKLYNQGRTSYGKI